MVPLSITHKNTMKHEGVYVMELNNQAAMNILNCGYMLSEYTLTNEEEPQYSKSLPELKIKKTSSAKQRGGLISTHLFSCFEKSQQIFENNIKIEINIDVDNYIYPI